MKKFLLSLAAIAMTVFTGGVANAAVQTITWGDVYSSISSSQSLDGKTEAVGDLSFSFAKNSGNNAPMYYDNGKALRLYADNTMVVTAPEGSYITAIDVTAGSGYGVSNLKASSGNLDGTNNKWSGSANSITFTVTSGQFRPTVMTVTYGTDNGNGGGTGGEVTPPVDPTPEGEEAIAAFYATASYTGTAKYSTQIVNNTNGDLVNPVTDFTAGDIQIYLEKKNSSSSNVSNNQVRWYQNDIMHITPLNGATITKIVVDEVSSYNKNVNASTGTASVSGNTLTWTGTANTELTLAAQAQIRFTVMTITYTVGSPAAVSVPQISCANNMVTITCETDGAQIYYTTDGTEPSNTSSLYSAPFAITANTTIKAIAYSGDDSSSVTTYNATYVGNYEGFQGLIAAGEKAEGTVNGPITTVYQNGQYLYVVDAQNYPMLVYGTTNNSYVNGQTVSYIKGTYSPYSNLPEVTNPTFGETGEGTPVEPLALTSAPTSDDVNRYIVLDNVSNITGSGSTYTGTFAGETITIYSRFTGVTIPTDNKVYKVTGFGSIFNTNIQVYPVDFEEVVEVGQVESPVFSPEGGLVEAGTEVTITCATEGATIYYTTDGTDPSTSSTEYKSPIEVNETMTIKAIAVLEGMTDSYVESATYTVPVLNPSPVTFDFTSEDYGMTRYSSGSQYNPNPTTVSQYPIDITLTGNTRLWTDGLRFFSGSAFTIASEKEENPITKIVIEYKTATIAGYFDIPEDQAGTYTTSGTTGTWTGKESSVDFINTISSSGHAILSITVYYYTEGDKEPAGLSFSDSEVTIAMNEEDWEDALPTLENPNDLDVTYNSSDTDVATVDEENGTVTLVGAGTTTISAIFVGNENYEEQTVSYTLTVTEPIKGNVAHIDWTSNCPETIAANQAYTLESYTQDNITVTAAKNDASTDPRWWSNNGNIQLRLYAKNTFTISIAEPYILTGIEFEATTAGNNFNASTEVDSGTLSIDGKIAMWKPAVSSVARNAAGEVSSVTFNVVNGTQFLNTTVYYDFPTGVEAVEAAEEGEAVYYNLQGVRVNNPERGIFVKVQNGKATKVVK